MKHKMLVGYASGSGSTKQVADFIAKAFKKNDVLVDVKEVSEVNDIDSYSAVVIGSSIRCGRWLPEATEFLEQFASALAERPFAFYITCLAILNESEDSEETALNFWTPILQKIPQAQPVGLGLFAGSLMPSLTQIDSYKNTPFGDYRDWALIGDWAQEIFPALLEGVPKATTPMVLSGTILSYTDMSGYDLSHFDFQGSEMVHARLKKAQLQDANLRLANLETADLQSANLSHANLGWAELANTSCQNANFVEANLTGSNFEQANLTRANLSKAALNGSILIEANLTEANFQNSNLNWGDLRRASLKGTDFRRANLAWANLSETDLSQSNLKGATYNSQTKWPEDFSPEAVGCILLRQKTL